MNKINEGNCILDEREMKSVDAFFIKLAAAYNCEDMRKYVTRISQKITKLNEMAKKKINEH